MQFGSREEIQQYDIYEAQPMGKLSDTKCLVTMMIGLPGSGKSTFAKDFVDDSTDYVSSDDIRDEKFNGEYSPETNGEVFKIFNERYEEALKQGKDVILDATHLKKKYREQYIALAKKYNARITAVFINVDYGTAYDRINNRGYRFIPKDRIRQMSFDVDEPTREEGFDDICVISKDWDTIFK